MYATCSSSLSIVNKWAILALPYPGVVTACQFLATAVFVFILGKAGALKVEPLEFDRMLKMAPINIIFYCAIFTNGKVLQYSTVETFIAFRSLTPLLVSCLDTLVRGEPMPSARTILCLAMIALGAATYAYDDANFSVVGYVWACIYLGIIVTEMVYAKHITSTIGLSTWGLVLYQNTIAMFIFPFASLMTGEFYDLARLFQSAAAGDATTPAPAPSSKSQRLLGAGGPTLEHRDQPIEAPLPVISPFAMVPLLISCALGIGISFAGWGTRSAISATQFTVLGVACKLATVCINVVVWDHHAALHAQLSIVLCIVASVAYQQSNIRDKAERAALVPRVSTVKGKLQAECKA